MKCALCLQDEKLRKSHIVPEFFYKKLYDKNPKRYFSVSSELGVRPNLRQSGIWEYLLCEKCENKLSRWESYAARLFEQEAAIIEKPGRLECHYIDYPMFKLFQLSVLWRAGASKRPEFQDINLGPHQECLRKMVLQEQPGSPEKYGCWLLLCPSFKNELQRMMLSPDMVKVNGHRVARFLMGGIFWNYFVSNHRPEIADHDIFLSQKGVLPISVENEITSEYLINEFLRIKRSGNLKQISPGENA